MLTLAELAKRLDAELVGDADQRGGRVGDHSVRHRQPTDFPGQPRYRSYLENTRAAAVLIPESQREFCR